MRQTFAGSPAGKGCFPPRLLPSSPPPLLPSSPPPLLPSSPPPLLPSSPPPLLPSSPPPLLPSSPPPLLPSSPPPLLPSSPPPLLPSSPPPLLPLLPSSPPPLSAWQVDGGQRLLNLVPTPTWESLPQPASRLQLAADKSFPHIPGQGAVLRPWRTWLCRPRTVGLAMVCKIAQAKIWEPGCAAVNSPCAAFATLSKQACLTMRYTLSPATENWARHVREVHSTAIPRDGNTCDIFWHISPRCSELSDPDIF